MDMFWRRFKIPTVSFATSCWEKDWKPILLTPDYLKKHLIGNHRFHFSEKILVVNNVKEPEKVQKFAEKKVQEKVLSRIVFSEKIAKDVLSFFQLERSSFKVGDDAIYYENVNPDWIYYNALGPLSAIYSCKSDYLLYVTGDVGLPVDVSWIKKALFQMEKNPQIKVANLTWNERFKEAKAEAYRKSIYFYHAKEGFSDQMFLVKTKDFQNPIFGEIRKDSLHFPRGDVFEKRVFSYMKNRGWERITYRWGSYLHENFK